LLSLTNIFTWNTGWCVAAAVAVALAGDFHAEAKCISP
jgi:hypothetical protein